MAIKKDQVSEETLQKARNDIQSAHGNILHEFRTGMKGFVFSMPDDQFSALETKEYVDFIEPDQEGNYIYIYIFHYINKWAQTNKNKKAQSWKSLFIF